MGHNIYFKNKLFRCFALSLITLVFIAQTGCTLIGAAVDISRNNKYKNAKHEKIKSGSYIQVTLRNGTVIKGRYEGIDHMAISAYREKLEEFNNLNQQGVVLPDWGEKITLSMTNGRTLNGKFGGFGYNEYGQDVIMVDDSIKVDLADLSQISLNESDPIQTGELRQLFREGQLPFLSTLLIKTGKNVTPIPMNEIAGIKSRSSASYGATFMGMIVDVSLLYAFSKSLSGSWGLGN